MQQREQRAGAAAAGALILRGPGAGAEPGAHDVGGMASSQHLQTLPAATGPAVPYTAQQHEQQQQHGQYSSIIMNPMFEWAAAGLGPNSRPHASVCAKPPPSLAWQPSDGPQGEAAQRHQTAVHIQPPLKAKEDQDDPAEQFLQAFLPENQNTTKRLFWTFWVKLAVVVIHVMVTGYTDPYISSNKQLLILLSLLQIVMLVVSIMTFFVVTNQTLAVRLGRYDVYLREFRWLYLVWAVELMLMLATKIYYIVLVQQNVPQLQVWYMTPYLVLWIVQRTGLCLFWVAIVYNSLKALDYKHYDPNRFLEKD